MRILSLIRGKKSMGIWSQILDKVKMMNPRSGTRKTRRLKKSQIWDMVKMKNPRSRTRER